VSEATALTDHLRTKYPALADDTKAVITLTKTALEFIYSERSLDEAWSDYEDSALELYKDNGYEESVDSFREHARSIFHDGVNERLKELKKHSRFTDNTIPKPEPKYSETGAEIAAALIAVMVSNPDNSIAGYVKLYSEALPKIREAIQQNATGSKIVSDPLIALMRLKPEQIATGSEILPDPLPDQNATGSKILPDPVPEQNATGSEKVMVAA
jgi:hypothetical protein